MTVWTVNSCLNMLCVGLLTAQCVSPYHSVPLYPCSTSPFIPSPCSSTCPTSFNGMDARCKKTNKLRTPTLTHTQTCTQREMAGSATVAAGPSLSCLRQGLLCRGPSGRRLWYLPDHGASARSHARREVRGKLAKGHWIFRNFGQYLPSWHQFNILSLNPRSECYFKDRKHSPGYSDEPLAKVQMDR